MYYKYRVVIMSVIIGNNYPFLIIAYLEYFIDKNIQFWLEYKGNFSPQPALSEYYAE